LVFAYVKAKLSHHFRLSPLLLLLQLIMRKFLRKF